MSKFDTAYKDAGVDIEAGAATVEAIRRSVESTRTAEVLGGIGGFGGLYRADALKDMAQPILVSGTDGVGTKLELARRAARLDTVGIDLVAMCVNDIICCGARPLFFLDYIAVGKLEPASVASIVKGIAAGCREAGCALIGGEMAEHPGIMAHGDFDLSGFCVGAVDRPKMLGPERVREGDVLIGVASSGLHSNGYSLVRHALTNKLSDKELLSATLDGGEQPSFAPGNEEPPRPAPGDKEQPSPVPGGKSLLIDALLEPTRIYARPLLAVLEAGLPVHAVAHITGGGITFNLDRALPAGLDAEVYVGSWPVPPVIERVAHAAGLNQGELFQTFNSGIGLVVICDESAALDVLEQFCEDGATVIGRVVCAANASAPASVLYRA